MNIVVVGINTEVGKTVLSAILTEALGGYYWKPLQCGMPTDSAWISERLSHKERIFPERYCLKTPCSPHLAARNEGIALSAKDFTLPKSPSHLIIEGAGGLLSPLNEKERWIDLACHWDAKWILIHRHYLGSLNHFFLTIEELKRRQIPLLGVVFNGEGDAQTEEMLIKSAQTKCLGKLQWQESIQKSAEEWRPLIKAHL